MSAKLCFCRGRERGRQQRQRQRRHSELPCFCGGQRGRQDPVYRRFEELQGEFTYEHPTVLSNDALVLCAAGFCDDGPCCCVFRKFVFLLAQVRSYVLGSGVVNTLAGSGSIGSSCTSGMCEEAKRCVMSCYTQRGRLCLKCPMRRIQKRLEARILQQNIAIPVDGSCSLQSMSGLSKNLLHFTAKSDETWE